MGHGRPKKLSLSPVQREIVWMLDEAGEENIPTILATLRRIFPQQSSEVLLSAVEQAIGGLLALGLVSLAWDSPQNAGYHATGPIEDSEHSLTLSEYVEYDEDSAQWRWNEAKAGQNRLNLILTERGQQAMKS